LSSTISSSGEFKNEIHHANNSYYPIFDNNDEITQIIEYSIDISSRKQREQKIKQYQKELVEKSKNLEKKNINLIHGLTNFRVLKQLPTYCRWVFLGWKNRKLIKSHLNNKTISK